MDVITRQQTEIAVSPFPAIVNVEVYRGSCPCLCVHCPIGVTPPSHRKQVFGTGEIALPLFRKIVQEIGAHSTPVLRIHSTGEPLLWKNLPKALETLKEVKLTSWLFTSAVTTDRSLLAGICEAVSIIEVSVNSITAEDYLATKGINGFDLVMENIQYMRSVIGHDKSKRLIASRVESDHPEMDDEFVRFWKASSLVDDAFIRSRHTYNDLIPELAPLSRQRPQKEPCLVHWARFNIALNGQAIICFNELFKEGIHPSLVLGDVNTESISEIWHGSRLTALRQAELTGDYSALGYEDVLPCKNCIHCQPLFGSEKETSEHQLEQMEQE